MAPLAKSAVMDVERTDESSEAIELAQRINRKLTDTSEIRLPQLPDDAKKPAAGEQPRQNPANRK